MNLHNNLLEDGCQWCFDKAIQKEERYIRKRLMHTKQERLSVVCPNCKFSNAVALDKDEDLRVYAVDTTYWRKQFLNKPNYVASIKNIYVHPNIIDILSKPTDNRCRTTRKIAGEF